MSLNEITTRCNVHNCKITVQSDYTRYLCFTRLGVPGSWILCVTDGLVLWRLEFDSLELDACSKLVNQPTTEDFLTKFGESFNSKDVTITQLGNKITLSLLNGLTFELVEASSADAKSENKYILFNLVDDLNSTETKLSTATEALSRLQTQMANAGSSAGAFMDLGPKKPAMSAKMKQVKEGMSVVNPMSRKRKLPQDDEDDDARNEEQGDNPDYSNFAESFMYTDDLDTSTNEGGDLSHDTSTDAYDNPDSVAAVWQHDNILLLIKVYGQMRKRFLIRGMKKKHVWEMIAVKLTREGVSTTANKCENKWKNLMRGYRICVKNGDPEKPCPYFNEITAIVETQDEDLEDDEDEEIAKEVTKRRLENGKQMSAFYWPRDAVLLLIKQYTQHKSYFMRPGMMKKHVWNLIAAEIEKRGHSVTASQCAGKWKNLTRQYRNAVEAEQRIDEDVKPGPYFNEVQEMYDGDDNNGDEADEQTSSASGAVSSNVRVPSEEPEESSPAETSRIIKFLGDITRQEQKDQRELLDKLGVQHREKMDLEERKMKLFESLMQRLPAVDT